MAVTVTVPEKNCENNSRTFSIIVELRRNIGLGVNLLLLYRPVLGNSTATSDTHYLYTTMTTYTKLME